MVTAVTSRILCDWDERGSILEQIVLRSTGPTVLEGVPGPN